VQALSLPEKVGPVTVLPGPTNTLTDVPGIRVGHASRRETGWLSGTTVVLPPPDGAVAGVDVRGGAPGTRETDLLAPSNLVDRVNAVVLTGGSAFGLAAADGVMEALYAEGLGWPVGGPGEVVPIVPAAVLFDLGRGGGFGNHPGAAEGSAAYAAASADAVPQGCVGAGTGAKAGVVKGGIGSASAVLPDGTTVAALIAVNPVGSVFDPATGELYAVRHGLGEEFADVPDTDPRRVAEAAREAAAEADRLRAGTATTIGVIATDATLTKAQCQRVSSLGHDGMARAIRPVHTLFDGDTVFTLATGGRPAPGLADLHDLMAAAGDCVTRAIGHAVLAAESVDCSAGGGLRLVSWRERLATPGRR
jgi:L-aminopeptidase/D-esterase-like protein